MVSNSSPLVSTIVIAHDRPDFLEQALNSVAHQTIEKGDHETILVKNFHDATIDGLCERLGVQNLYTEEASALGKVREGLARSRGEILTFLDYDDVYRPDRLQCLVAEFRSNPRLGYYHNGMEIIDAQSQPIAPWNLSFSFRLVANQRARRWIRDSEKSRTDPRLGGCRPDFNTGSMAVRRAILDQCRPYLERVQLTLDSLLFSSSWISNFDLLIDPRKLTQYRIHRGNSSVVPTGTGGPAPVFIDYARLREIDHRVIAEMVEQSSRVELARDLRLRETRERIVELLRRPGISRSDLIPFVRELGSSELRSASPLVWSEAGGYLVAGLASPALSRTLVRIAR